MDWGFHLVVVLVGLTVVFLVLFLLVTCCSLMGMFFRRKDNKPKEKKEPPAPAKKQDVQAAAPAPAVQSGISNEVVAAIAGALACMLGGEGKTFRMHSVRRSKEARPAWNAAGIADNTRPF